MSDQRSPSGVAVGQSTSGIRLLAALDALRDSTSDRRDRMGLQCGELGGRSAHEAWGRARAVDRGVGVFRHAVAEKVVRRAQPLSGEDLMGIVAALEIPELCVDDWPCARAALVELRRRLAAWVRAGMPDDDWPGDWDV